MRYRRFIALYKMERERLGIGIYIIVSIILTLINIYTLLLKPISDNETTLSVYTISTFIALTFLYVMLFANQLKKDFRGPWYILHTYPLSTFEISFTKILAFFSVFGEAVLYTQLSLLPTHIYRAFPKYWIGIIFSPLINIIIVFLLSGIVLLLSRYNLFPEILFAGYLLIVFIYSMIPKSNLIFALLPTLKIVHGHITSHVIYGLLGYISVFVLSIVILSLWKGVKFKQ